MKNASKLPSISVQPTEQGFAYWCERPYLTDELKHRLSLCPIVLIPREKFPGHDGPVFADETQQVFEYLTEHLPTGLSAEVCIEEEDYKEVALLHDWLQLGEFLVKEFALPTVVGLLVAWLGTRLMKPGLNVSVSFTVERDEAGTKKATTLSYQGPPKEMQAHINKAMRDLTGREAVGADPAYPKEPRG